MLSLIQQIALLFSILEASASVTSCDVERPFAKHFMIKVQMGDTDDQREIDIRDLTTIKIFQAYLQKHSVATGKSTLRRQISTRLAALEYYKAAEEAASAKDITTNEFNNDKNIEEFNNDKNKDDFNNDDIEEINNDKTMDDFNNDIRKWFLNKSNVKDNKIRTFLRNEKIDTPFIKFTKGYLQVSCLSFMLKMRSTLYFAGLQNGFTEALAKEIVKFAYVFTFNTDYFSHICISIDGKKLHRKINSQLLFCINFIIILGNADLLTLYRQFLAEKNGMYKLIQLVPLMEESLSLIKIRHEGPIIHGIYLHKNYQNSKELKTVIEANKLKVCETASIKAGPEEDEYYFFADFMPRYNAILAEPAVEQK
ncbi:hypothetical protein ENBRE01_2081 [Enteropsectra breve]|nr:hypothetical protein ENBRE01_2081 [Enteropsectra breve]